MRLDRRDSGNSCCFDLRTPARACSGLHSIPSIVLGAVERLIGRLQNEIGIRFSLGASCDADADGHRKRRRFVLDKFSNGLPLARATAWPLVAPVWSAWHLSPVAAAHAKLRKFNCFAQLLQMIDQLGGGLSWKQNVEFLPAATVGLSSAGHARQAGRNQP